MQYSNHQVEAEWRSFFSRKQQSADTIFGATGLLYGAATTSRVFNNLPAGAATPHLTVGLLALAQWIVLIMLVGGLMRQHWWSVWRPRLIWLVPTIMGVSAAYWSAGVYTQLPTTSPSLNFLRMWCLKGKWLLLSLMGYGVRQPLDDHMTSQWPGILAALGLNQEVCAEVAANPEYRLCLHAVYRVGRFAISPGATTLQHAVLHREAPTAVTFTQAQAALVCQITFAASQLLLAFASNCLLVLRREWSDRVEYLARPELRNRGIRIHFNRLSDVLSIMLLEAAVFFVVSE